MRAVIFANGLIENISLVRPLLKQSDYLIAADGGLRYILELGLLPDLLIGDLDSVLSADMEFLRKNSTEMHTFNPDKDQTDLELAMKEAVLKGYKDILVVGAMGGRTDQTLANIGLLSGFKKEAAHIEFDDGKEHLILIEEDYSIQGRIGDTVSLLPLSAPVAGITTNGLKFPLNGETLYPDQTRGISNEMTKSSAKISVGSGKLLCLHTRVFN